MADVVDISDERVQIATDTQVAKVRQQAAQMPKGKPGECDLCGEHSQRLVRGACAPCRDKYKLK